MKLFTLACGIILSSTLSPAAVIYDNGAPNTSEANSRGIALFRTADDFVVGAPSSAKSVTFWMMAEPGAFLGALSYGIYQDSAGALGTQIASGSVSNVTPTFLNVVPQYIYSYYLVNFDLVSPVQLNPGKYWLEVHNGANLTDSNSTNVYWGIVANNPVGNARQSPAPTLPTGATTSTLAFMINGDPIASSSVPEPATVAISSAGLLAIILLRRR